MTLLRTESAVSRASIQLRRQARRMPLYRAYLARDHARAREAYKPRIPPPSPSTAHMVRTLEERGIVRCMLSDLTVVRPVDVLAVDRLGEMLRSVGVAPQSGRVLCDQESLIDTPEPYLMGMQDTLLDLAESYFGLPVSYLGACIKREFADGRETMRRWHFDPEDERVLKLIVYLNDVQLGGGPFELLDPRLSARVARTTGYLWGGSLDTRTLLSVVPSDGWLSCYGPRFSACVVDAARCLHRASPPTSTDRYSLTFSYLSKKAYFVFSDGVALQRAFLARHGDSLSPRQRACLEPLV